MKVKIYNLIFFLFGSFTMITALFLHANFNKPMFKNPDFMERKLNKTLQKLNLTESQYKKIKACFTKDGKQPLFNDMHLHMERIKNELLKETPDTTEIYKIHNNLKKIFNENFDNGLEQMLKIRNILSLEEYKQFENEMNKKHRPQPPL